MDVRLLVETLSYPGLFLIPAVETGLLIGFFLPGDSLLIAVGLLAGAGAIRLELALPLLFLGAYLGHQLGYAWGRRLGGAVRARMRPEHFERTQAFLARRGQVALVLAPFVPIVRTGAPFLAGAFRFPYPRYALLSLLGTALWTQGVTLLGYFLGRSLPGLDRYLLPIVLLVVLLSLLPALLEYQRQGGR